MILKSKFPYLANISAHLDPLGIPLSGVEVLTFQDSDDLDILEDEVKVVAREVQLSWKGCR